MDISSEIASKSADFKAELQRALSSDTQIETDEPQGFQGEGVFFGAQPPRMRLDEYLKSATGWVYGCITRIADAVASVPIRLYESSKDGEITEVMQHPALDLLAKVNNYTTQHDHMWLTQQYLELVGEAPWFVSRGKDGKQEPDSMLLLRPDRLSIIPNKDAKAESPILKYVYKTDDNQTVDIAVEELIFLKYPDAINIFRGKGTLMAAAKTVDIDNFSEDYNRRFFYNSARPDSILSTEQKLSSPQRLALQQQVRKLYQGGDKAHKTAILESGLKWTPMSISAKDMDFLAQQKYDMTKIFSIFGVPKTIMSVADDVNLANAKVGEYIFSKYTVKPKMTRIVAQLNEFLLPMFKGSEALFFSFDNTVQEDVIARVARYDSGLSKGWLTINEVRYEENLEDIGAAGDATYVPNSIVPIEMAGQTQPTPGQQNGVGKKYSAPGQSRRGIVERSAGGFSRVMRHWDLVKKNLEVKKELHKKIEQSLNKIDKFALAMAKKLVLQKKHREIRKEADRHAVVADFTDSYVKSINTHEKKFTVTMQTIFEEQAKKVLGKFPSKSIKADPTVSFDDISLDEQDETQIMVNVFDPLMTAAVAEAGARAAKLAGSTFDLATEAVQDYLKNRTFKFAGEVNAETNALLQTALADGVAAGESIPQLKARVQELFDGMQDYRAERIARSEVVRASNFAATEAYDQSGVVEGVQWIVTPDDRLCPYCEELDGKTISLGDNFFNKGDTVTGSDNSTFDLNYEDVEFPPLHPNCRCTVVPIVK